MSSIFAFGIFLIVLCAALFVPGWLFGRALGTSGGLVGSFLGSAAVLLNVVLLLDALRRPIDGQHVLMATCVVCGLLFLAGRRRLQGTTAPSPESQVSTLSPIIRWGALLATAIGIVAIGVRVVMEPLSGFDTYFRWDFLARQMISLGSLDFYPAVADEHFGLYGWCDGIAPLVSALYAVAYLAFGRIDQIAVQPVVLLQVALQFRVLFQLGSSYGKGADGIVACGAFAASSAALWGISMGQETGLTALGLAAMVFFITQEGRDPRNGQWLVWAGIAAGIGGLAREYGLVFVAVGAVGLAQLGTPRQGWIKFLAAAILVAGPWYVRNWVKTGNPLWPHSLFGLFPAPPLQIEYLEIVNELGGIRTAPGLLVSLVVVMGSVPLLLGFPAAAARFRTQAMPIVAITTTVALWLWSVGQTSGGYAYSIRMLTPALAIGSAISVPLLADWDNRRARLPIALLLAGFATDAGFRSLYLPFERPTLWWKNASTAFNSRQGILQNWQSRETWRVLTDAAEGRNIIVVDPSSFRRFADQGARPLSIFSPGLAFLFAEGSDFETQILRLRTRGSRFILIPRHNTHFDRLLSRHAFFRVLPTLVIPTVLPEYVLYDLYRTTISRPQ